MAFAGDHICYKLNSIKSINLFILINLISFNLFYFKNKFYCHNYVCCILIFKLYTFCIAGCMSIWTFFIISAGDEFWSIIE